MKGREKVASNSTFCRLIVGILLFGSVTESAHAAGGIVVTDVSGRAYAMVIDNLGRIVTAGSPRWSDGFALTRYDSDGTLDTTYGSGGVVIDPHDRKGFVDAARRLLADTNLRQELGECARRFAEERFLIDRVATRFEEVLTAVTQP